MTGMDKDILSVLVQHLLEKELISEAACRSALEGIRTIEEEAPPSISREPC